MIEVFSVFRNGLSRDRVLQHIHGALVNGRFKSSVHLRVAFTAGFELITDVMISSKCVAAPIVF